MFTLLFFSIFHIISPPLVCHFSYLLLSSPLHSTPLLASPIISSFTLSSSTPSSTPPVLSHSTSSDPHHAEGTQCVCVVFEGIKKLKGLRTQNEIETYENVGGYL